MCNQQLSQLFSHRLSLARPHQAASRSGFTLIELMLTLSLIVVTAALIGSLMQMFSRNFATRGDDIRREQLARALLTKMADDIRSVVMPQEYDASVLEQLLGASSGGSSETPAEPDASSSLASSAAPTSNLGAASSATGEALSDTVTTSLPPGIYGDQYSLIVDVSRIPRSDEYIMPAASLIDPFVADVPGDMKTVSYFVQSPTNMGIEDSLAQFSTPDGSASAANPTANPTANPLG